MGVPTSEVSYTSATTGRGDHEVHKGHVVAMGKKIHFQYRCVLRNVSLTILNKTANDAVLHAVKRQYHQTGYCAHKLH
jgi:hypothetical protein